MATTVLGESTRLGAVRARAWARMSRKIKSEQRAWLGGRNACGYDQGCLRRAYRNRINRLENWVDQL